MSAVTGLVITSGGLVFAALEAEGLDGASRSTSASQAWILGIGLFTVVVGVITVLDPSRRLRARQA